MRRLVGFTAALVAIAWGALALGGAAIAPAYLAVWLAFLAVPAGALPVVMGLELSGQGGSRQSGYVRWLLVLMPAAALAGVPLATCLHALYPWAGHPPAGLPGAWFSPLAFCLRGAVCLLAWCALGLALVRPPSDQDAPRVGLCLGGLCVHVCLTSLAATDWVMSLSAGLHSAIFGLLFLAMQSGIAICVGLLVASVRPAHALALLMMVAGAAALLSLLQYLVVWSADKPGEIVWYMQRDGWAGRGVSWLGALAVAACLLLLGPARQGRRRGVLVGCAGLLLVWFVAEMFWLVTPSVRGVFVVPAGDLACLTVACVLVSGMIWLVQPPRVRA